MSRQPASLADLSRCMPLLTTIWPVSLPPQLRVSISYALVLVDVESRTHQVSTVVAGDRACRTGRWSGPRTGLALYHSWCRCVLGSWLVTPFLAMRL